MLNVILYVEYVNYQTVKTGTLGRTATLSLHVCFSISLPFLLSLHPALPSCLPFLSLCPADLQQMPSPAVGAGFCSKLRNIVSAGSNVQAAERITFSLVLLSRSEYNLEDQIGEKIRDLQVAAGWCHIMNTGQSGQSEWQWLHTNLRYAGSIWKPELTHG